MKTRKVLVSPGYGAGWSSWSSEKQQEIAEYAPIIEYIEAGGDVKALESDSHSLVVRMMRDLDLDYFYTGGGGRLKVVTVKGRYRIDEYDGSEYIVTDDSLWS